jgi:hypothetical protein
MHFHLPKPLHGWRELAGEVGIIVIGVLIALGAEQVVEAAHWRIEVHHFREAVDQELGRNLAIYHNVMEQRPCVDRRLAELERLLADSTAGRQDKLLRPIGRPLMQSQYFSVWEDKSAEITTHLPLDTRLKYSELYDEFRNNDVVRTSERDVWRDLAQFDQPEPLDHADRMRLRQLLTKAESANAITAPNLAFIMTLVRPLHIQPVVDPLDIHLPPGSDFCQPLLAGS